MSRLVSLPILVLCLAGCGDPSNQASGSASAAAPAKSGQAATPAKSGGGDPKIMAELAKAKGCKVDDENFDGECKGREAFDELKTKLLGDEASPATKQSLYTSCFAGLSDPDVAVRLTAASGFDGLELEPAQKDALLTKIEAEQSWAVKRQLLEGLHGLSPKQSETLVALAQKWKTDPKGEQTVASTIDAMMPVDDDAEPPKAAVDFALDFAGTTDGSSWMGEAIRLAAKSKARAADTCKKAAEIAKARKAGWFAAMKGVSLLKDACKPDFDAFVDAFVADLGNADTVGNEIEPLKGFLENPALSKEQKAKIAKAAEALSKNAKNENVKGRAKEVAELAKK